MARDAGRALRDAGWHNYSLFVRPDDGLVVGYLETEDFAAARSRMARTAVNQRWQAGMAQYFDTTDGEHPDEAMRPLTEYSTSSDQTLSPVAVSAPAHPKSVGHTSPLPNDQ